MSDRQIKLYSQQTTGGRKDITTTINNVNPSASGEVMKNYAKMLNRLTDNTYSKSDLVETTNLDTETVKIMPKPSINSTTGTIENLGIRINITTNSSGTPFGCANRQEDSAKFAISGTPASVYIKTNESGTYTCYIGTLETNTHYAQAISATITVS